MDMIEKIFDLHVIAQGALGSFVFWLIYLITQRSFNAATSLVGKYNKNLQKENILYEQAHLMQDLFPIEHPAYHSVHIVSIQASIYKFIQGFIFLGFGLIASEILGLISIVAYLFAIYYFFRALKAGFVASFSDGKTQEERQERLDYLIKKLEKLNAE